MHVNVIIDAILGIGLHSPLRGDVLRAVHQINKSSATIISADIPTGLSADTGRILGSAVYAHETVTFTCAKIGMILDQGALCCGKISVCDIGIPQEALETMPRNIFSMHQDDVKRLLPVRKSDGHKGTFGRAYILAGSIGFTGAPILAADAASRSGAGLVHLGVPNDIYPIIASHCMETMPHPLSSQDGKVSFSACAEISNRLSTMQAALIGPGLGQSDDLRHVIKQLLERASIPIVLDADGINLVSMQPEILQCYKQLQLILTPHDGELARFGIEFGNQSRLSIAQEFSRQYNCVLVLKGHRTIVAAPDGRAYINQTGNDGMAKGGSGDVLGGIIVSLLAQGMALFEAACCAVWVHGRAGDLCAQQLGRRGMLPSDMIQALPAVWKDLE